jgi:hypothetical protein
MTGITPASRVVNENLGVARRNNANASDTLGAAFSRAQSAHVDG